MIDSTQYQINCQICFCIAFSSSNSDSEDSYSSSNNQFQNSLNTLEQSNKKDNESFDSSEQQDQEKSIVDCFTDIGNCLMQLSDHTQQIDERITKMNQDLSLYFTNGIHDLGNEIKKISDNEFGDCKTQNSNQFEGSKHDLKQEFNGWIQDLKQELIQELEQIMQEQFEKQLEQISMLLKQNNKQDGQSNQTNQVQN